jgi:hypothetical protein
LLARQGIAARVGAHQQDLVLVGVIAHGIQDRSGHDAGREVDLILFHELAELAGRGRGIVLLVLLDHFDPATGARAAKGVEVQLHAVGDALA